MFAQRLPLGEASGHPQIRCPSSAANHQVVSFKRLCQISQTFSPAIISAMPQESSFNHNGLTNSPINWRSLVNMTNGNTANDSWKLKSTWLKMSNLVVPPSPNKTIQMRVGIIAASLLITRRNQGTTRRFKKPSMTICPAKVAVRVEL